eukprot:Em0037g33a
MAKLLKIGAAVTARVGKVIGSRAAAALYGKNSKSKRVTGTIRGTNGRGRSRKCFFFPPILNKRTEFSSRSLEMVESGIPTLSNSGVQNTIQMNAVDVRVDEDVNAVDVHVDEDVNAATQ